MDYAIESKQERDGGLTPSPGGEGIDSDEALLRAVADRIVRMGLAVPAVFFLESTKPLSFVGSQALVFLEPFVKAFLNLRSYDRFTALLEDRANVERLIRKVEEVEDERARAEREAKKARKEAKGEPRSRWFRKRKS